jgi:hypothetical protein
VVQADAENVEQAGQVAKEGIAGLPVAKSVQAVVAAGRHPRRTQVLFSETAQDAHERGYLGERSDDAEFGGIFDLAENRPIPPDLFGSCGRGFGVVFGEVVDFGVEVADRFLPHARLVRLRFTDDRRPSLAGGGNVNGGGGQYMAVDCAAFLVLRDHDAADALSDQPAAHTVYMSSDGIGIAGEVGGVGQNDDVSQPDDVSRLCDEALAALSRERGDCAAGSASDLFP